MTWTTPKTWTADTLLTASDLNQYLSDNMSALYALVQGGGRKNLVQNGAFQVAQRGTSSAGQTTSGYYTADRWWAGINALGTWTQSVEADAPTGSGFRNSLKMLMTSGAEVTPGTGDFVRVTQRMAGRDLQAIKKGTSSAEQTTLSFWVKSNKTGVYVVELYDVDNTRHVSSTYTVVSSATWESHTVTFPADLTGALDNDANRSLDLVFWLAAGTDWTGGTLDTTWAAVTSEGASPGTTPDNNRAGGQTNLAGTNANYWQVAGCQLEIGSAATGYQTKDYNTELVECSPYYNPSWLPVGSVNPYGGSAAPTGWLLCYGQAVSRTTYSDLFAVLGTSFGTGDGSTTFNVPDLRGRTAAGIDNMGGSDAGRLDWANTMGTASGAQTHALSTAELASHNHTQNSHNHTQDSHNHTQNAHAHTLQTSGGYYASIWGSAGGTTAGAFTYTVYNDPLLALSTTATNIATTATNQAATATNNSAGSGTAHNNMQPTILLNYIVKALGPVPTDL